MLLDPESIGGRAGRRPPLSNIAPVFAALGDETRLQIVEKLSAGRAMSISELTVGSDITRQAITKHLRVLADTGLVRDTRIGRERRWHCEPSRLEEARRSLDRIARQWDHALLNLKKAVEE